MENRYYDDLRVEFTEKQYDVVALAGITWLEEKGFIL